MIFKDLQAFLGLTDYLSRLTPHVADVSVPLRDLCEQDVEFLWGPELTKAFQTQKTIVSSSKVLKYYNSTKTLVIQVYASQRGLGAGLIQPSGPIANVSKSLMETEQR